MTKLQFFIFLILVAYIHSSCSGTASSAGDCKDDMLSDIQKGNEMHCCYVTSKGLSDNQEYKNCDAISKVGYENLGDYIKYSEMMGLGKDVSVDCKSLYLQFSLISLFLLFL